MADESDAVHVLILEPDPDRAERLKAFLSGEAGFRVVGAGDELLEVIQLPVLQQSPVHVLLVNLDQPKMAETGMWAAIQVLLPGARIAAFASGENARILETALAAGVLALHRPDIGPDRLRQAVRNAAQGVVDRDPWLIQRVRPLLMRPSEAVQVRVGELTIDLQTREVTLEGKPIHLTPLEFQVLAYLAHNRGRWVSLEELLEAVWHTSIKEGGTTAQVKNCIRRLREKIEPDIKHPQYIRSRRGWGYSLQDVPVNKGDT